MTQEKTSVALNTPLFCIIVGSRKYSNSVGQFGEAQKSYPKARTRFCYREKVPQLLNRNRCWCAWQKPNRTRTRPISDHTRRILLSTSNVLKQLRVLSKNLAVLPNLQHSYPHAHCTHITWVCWCPLRLVFICDAPNTCVMFPRLVYS